MTASLEELKQALAETLENRGVLGQVKAKVRAEIFAALDDEQAPRPEIPRENVVINELVREYLEYNGYHHTLSVLLPESGHPHERQFDRRFLASELQVQEDDRSRSMPLLYALVSGLKSGSAAVATTVGADDAPVSAGLSSLAGGLERSHMLASGGGAMAVGGCGSFHSGGAEFASGAQPAPLVIHGNRPGVGRGVQ
eukprot:TRINITY_DN74993_c0_g1_i1.p1 TRINITY_DN74993_c0_g1~~TRINITY_DN74993_c0_g1_i1.p1  ORF type:complete len:197 (-),score=37.97 TRINITY_DN74993_c0_g1_i1:154-744(-)